MDKIHDYDIEASVKGSGLKHQDIKNILSRYNDRSDDDLIIEKKRRYHPLALELERTNRFAIQSKIVPDALWAGIESKKLILPTEQDYVFSIWSRGIIFNELCVNILKQHKLGENILTPVQIYDLSTGNLVSDETYYFLNLYERREYICENQTNIELTSIPTSYGVMSFSGYIKNQDVDVHKSALNCDIDLWYDPRFLGHFFMSESLYQSLNQQSMIDKFNPYTCNLI